MRLALPLRHHRVLVAGIAASLSISALLIGLALTALSAAGSERAAALPTPPVYHDPAVIAEAAAQSEPTAPAPAPTTVADPDAKFAPVDVAPPGEESQPPEQPAQPSPGQPASGQPQPTLPPSSPSEPEPIGITIVAPADGSTVPSTFTMQVAVTGIELRLGPGGALIPGFGHWHLAIDQSLKQQPRVATSTQIGPLSPGEHALTATLNLNDADATVVALAQITVTVQ